MSLTLWRRLGVAEEAMDLLECQRGSGHSVEVVELEDVELDPDRMTAALATIAARHPLVRARIADGSDGPAFAAHDELPPGVVRIVPRRRESEWMDVANAELNAAFEHGDPLIRVHLVIGDDIARSEIVITVHHAAFDAQSLVLVAREMLTAYDAQSRGEPAGDTFIAAPRPAVEEMLGYPLTAEFEDGPLRAFIERQIVLRAEVDLAGFDAPDAATAASSRSRLVHRSLPGGVAQALRSRCRAEGASVQSALGAALLAAGRDELCAESLVTLPLVTAVTLRRRLADVGDTQVGLFSTGVRTVHQVDRRTNFWALAREIRQSVEDCVREEEDVAALLLQREAVREYVDARQAGFAWLSNLGSLELPNPVAGGRVRAIHAAVAMHAMGPVLLAPAATVGGRFSWNFVHPDPAIAPATADAFSRRAVEHLVSSCREDAPSSVAAER